MFFKIKLLLLFPLLAINCDAFAQACYQPSGLTFATSISSSSVAFTWSEAVRTANNVSPFSLAYVYGYKKATSSTWIETTTNLLAVQINNIESGTNYELRVRTVASCSDNFDQPLSDNFTSAVATRLTYPSTPTLNQSGTVLQTTTSSINFLCDPVNGEVKDYIFDISAVSDFSTLIEQQAVKAPSVSVTQTGLTPGTNYYYRVRASNYIDQFSGGVSLYSLPSGPIPTVTLAPAFPPTSASSITSTSFKVDWNAPVGASSYRFDLSLDPNFNSFLVNDQTVNTTFFTVSGLTSGTTYYYRVRSVNSAGVPSTNSVRNEALTSPITPMGFAVNSITSNSITANWTAAATATAYELLVSTDPNFNTSITNYNPKVINQPSVSDIVSGLLPATTYYLKLRAKNGSNSYSVYTPAITVSTLSEAPTFPSTYATSISTGSFQANWNTVSGASSYQLDVSVDPNFNSFIFNNQAVNGIFFAVANLLGGTTYYYRVRSINSAGMPSANSLPKEVLTSPIIPTGFSVSSTTSSSMSVNWVTAPTATLYELSVASDQGFNAPVASYSPKIVSTPTISEQITGLSASTTYYLRLRAKNGTTSYSDYTYASAQTKPIGGGVGFTLSPNVLGTHIAGEAQDISVEIANGTPPVTVTLYHRQNSQTNFTTENIPLATSSTYKIAVNDAWLDKFGMEYYFVASDANNPRLEKKDTEDKPFKIVKGVSSVTVPLLGFGTGVKDYQIISFPFKIQGRLQVQDVFEQVMGSYDKKKWRLFQYKDGRTVEYSEGVAASNIEQGQAYWFISKAEKTLSFGRGETYANSSSMPFTLKLKKGWNQIGNPFPYDLGWADVQLANPLLGKLNVFDKATVSFVESDALKVFSGGFVFAESPIDVIFPVTLPNKGGRKASSTEDSDLNTNGWSLPIQVSQGEVTNAGSGIGMRSDALEGKDKFDRVTLPRFLRYVEMNSKKPDYEFDLSTDVVATAENYKWNFSVESNSSEPVDLKWSKQTVAALDAQMILYDQTKHVLIDMAKLATYTTEPNAKFLIHYRKPNGLEFDKIEFGKPFPNPFATELTITYDYAPEAITQAEITIYDLSGRVLFQQTINSTSSDIKQFNWNGMTQQGGEVQSGLYLYKIKATNNGEPLGFNGKIIKQ